MASCAFTVTFRAGVNAERIVIAAGGSVEGDVVATDAFIEGRLNGRIFALNVTLESSAEITGRVFHNTITVRARCAHRRADALASAELLRNA